MKATLHTRLVTLGALIMSSPIVADDHLSIAATSKPFPTMGKLEAKTEDFWKHVDQDARLEVLSVGHEWTEGPVWRPGQKEVLFSDIPNNAVYRWRETKEGGDFKLFLRPAGYTGYKKRGGEVGSNGLTLDPEGRLVLCQHGDRRMARLEGNGQFHTLADRYQGQRFNSPNDACYDPKGDLYFTDPPYGLEFNMLDPEKEIPWQGVYRLSKATGKITLLTSQMSRPNGLAFSPDFKKLYVANSDPKKAVWMVYDVDSEGLLQNGKVLFDATSLVGKMKGLPDGLKVASDGTLFATGPGGVLLISPFGKHLGTILTGQATANCCFGPSTDGGSTLFVCCDMYFARIDVKSRSATAP